MGKLSIILANLVPFFKRVVFPNGKFDRERAIVILVLFVIILFCVELFGASTVISATELLKPLVELIGVTPE